MQHIVLTASSLLLCPLEIQREEDAKGQLDWVGALQSPSALSYVLA